MLNAHTVLRLLYTEGVYGFHFPCECGQGVGHLLVKGCLASLLYDALYPAPGSQGDLTDSVCGQPVGGAPPLDTRKKNAHTRHLQLSSSVGCWLKRSSLLAQPAE
jgi:hypothetical protein